MKFCDVLNVCCGMDDSVKYSNHCWREFSLGRLANDPTVNQSESLSFDRHSDPKSQQPYIRSGANSSVALQHSLCPVKFPSVYELRRMKKKSTPPAGPAELEEPSVKPVLIEKFSGEEPAAPKVAVKKCPTKCTVGKLGVKKCPAKSTASVHGTKKATKPLGKLSAPKPAPKKRPAKEVADPVPCKSTHIAITSSKRKKKVNA